MAKKEKKEKRPLTPEELKAKRERKAEKRKLFGKTFVQVLAVLLAIVLVYSVVYMAFGQGMTVVKRVAGNAGNAGGAPVYNGGSASGGSSSGSTDSGSSGSSTPAATPASSGGSSSGGGASAGANDPASVAQLINSATAAAVNAKAGYSWSRDCTVSNIDVGGAGPTGIINRLIGTISEGDDLNSVVGGFLGNGSKKETVPKGMTLDTIDVPKDDGGTEKLYHGSSYTLKASQLQASDIQGLRVSGNTYEFDLPNSTNPTRDGNTALSRFCNDIVVREEVESELKGYTNAVSVNSLEANYNSIHVKATIEDGKLTALTYSMKADAKLGIKIGINITGTGNLEATASYTNFSY
ncbi:MAG: hypothetical protein IJL63_07615 [Clostridia bacterium]|nr:hypothetical protein [Clostridia bacterium]